MFLLSAASDFCDQTASIWGVVGYFVLILKIVIPIVLIVLGMIDLGKAVISSDDKEIGKAVGTLLKRFIAAVIVFFVPSIVSALFNMVIGLNVNDASINKCVQCVTNVTGQADAYCKSTLSIPTGYDGTTSTNNSTNPNQPNQSGQ